jgi:hypothetical protein
LYFFPTHFKRVKCCSTLFSHVETLSISKFSQFKGDLPIWKPFAWKTKFAIHSLLYVPYNGSWWGKVFVGSSSKW